MSKKMVSVKCVKCGKNLEVKKEYVDFILQKFEGMILSDIHHKCDECQTPNDEEEDPDAVFLANCDKCDRIMMFDASEVRTRYHSHGFPVPDVIVARCDKCRKKWPVEEDQLLN
jgi:hypothetical protein